MRSLHQLYNECRDLSLVGDQRQFSQLWGKQPSWFSSTASRGRRPTVAAMIAFYVQLEKIAQATGEELDAETDPEAIEALRNGLNEVLSIRREVWEEIMSKSGGIVAGRP